MKRRLLLLVAAGLSSALAWSSLGTFSSASGQEQPMRIDRAHTGQRSPSFDKPLFFMILGGDARSKNPENTRMDSIHILAVDPVNLRAAILGIPRDTYVEIPGHGQDKIAHAGFFGGPRLMIDTLENLTTCRFAYYMLTSFEGFRGPRPDPKNKGGLINEIGGIHLDVPSALDSTGGYALRAGYQLLNGKEALGWSRNRKDASRPNGDFSRSLAQGTLMIAGLREARADFKRSPGSALRMLGALRRNLRMNIGLTESFELGLVALRIAPKNVQNRVMDGALGTAPGGASIVTVTERAREQFADICSDGRFDAG